MDGLHSTLRTTPADYGDSAHERAALDRGNALLDLRDHDVLDVCGADRLSYLHTKLTQHAMKLPATGGDYTTATDIDGKLLFDAWCYALDDRVRMLLRPGTADAAVDHLDRFVIMEDVTFERPSLGALAVSPLDALPLDDAAPWELASHQVADVDVSTALLPHLTASPLQVVFSPVEQLDAVADGLVELGATRVGAIALAEHQVAYGIASVPRDVPLGKHIPLEAGLFHGIHFSKGCYLGQEVIERLFSRGRPNKRLMTLTWSGDVVEPGTPLLSGEREAGVVTASFRDGDMVRALGYVRRKYLPEGERAASDALVIAGSRVTVGDYVGGETAVLDG